MSRKDHYTRLLKDGYSAKEADEVSQKKESELLGGRRTRTRTKRDIGFIDSNQVKEFTYNKRRKR